MWYDIISNLSVIIASTAAIYGIFAWRKETRGQKQMDLAEETLALFYQARDGIIYMRNPGSFGHEGKTRTSEGNETENEKNALDRAYILMERYQRYQDIFNEIYSKRYRFMALFGKKSGEPFEELRKLVSRILLSSNRLARIWAENEIEFEDKMQKKKYYTRMRREESYFWEGTVEKDPVNPKLEKIIKKIEAICFPALRGRTAMWRKV